MDTPETQEIQEEQSLQEKPAHSPKRGDGMVKNIIIASLVGLILLLIGGAVFAIARSNWHQDMAVAAQEQAEKRALDLFQQLQEMQNFAQTQAQEAMARESQLTRDNLRLVNDYRELQSDYDSAQSELIRMRDMRNTVSQQAADDRKELQQKIDQLEGQLYAEKQKLEACKLTISNYQSQLEELGAKMDKTISEETAATRAANAVRLKALEQKLEIERFRGEYNGYYFFSDESGKGWYARTSLDALGEDGARAIRHKLQLVQETIRQANGKYGTEYGKTLQAKYDRGQAMLKQWYAEAIANPTKVRK